MSFGNALADRACVILWEPQDPINVGSVVRACRNHGLADLRLVRPASADVRKLTISAPHSEEWISRSLRVVETWEEAVSGVHRLVAFTARGREERQRRERLSAVCAEMKALQCARWGLVFGREDRGLPNQIVDRCDLYVTIETHDEYPSMNLAQAVVVALHALFEAMGSPVPMLPAARAFPPARHDQITRMMAQAERALESIGFFRGDQRENNLRTLHRILRKAEVDEQELATLWAIVAAVEAACRDGGASDNGGSLQK